MSKIIRDPGDWKEDWCNFKPDEFRCSCCNRLEIAADLIDLLQKAREALGPLVITSAYRCVPIITSRYLLQVLMDHIRPLMLWTYMYLTHNIESYSSPTLQIKFLD